MAEISVNIKGKLYPINQLIGKTIYAGNLTKLYPGADDTRKAYFQVPTGGIIGNMYSWVVASNGVVYLMFYTKNAAIGEKYGYTTDQKLGLKDTYYFAKLSDVNGDTLQKQGAKTTEQIEKEAADKDKSFADKALETGTKVILWGAAIFAVAGIVKNKI